MTRSICIFFCVFIMLTTARAQDKIDRIDPPNWWANMKNKEVQLLVGGKNISLLSTVTIDSKAIQITGIKPAQNPNYLFVNLLIDSLVAPGKYNIKFSGKAGKPIIYTYEIKERGVAINAKSVTNADLIYLLMPDRFANGDKANDVIENFSEKKIDRDSILTRHGGDLKGVMDHLDYIKEFGATTLWLNPVQENNQPLESYHGYAITDHYKIDPRLGTLADYMNLVNNAHEKGMKVVMDMVFNHIGNEHYLFKNLPTKDWVHEFQTFTRTNYRATTLMDPHASEYDKNLMTNGWFDKHMPDLNQKNYTLAQYLICNALWWIETTGINGYRVDTWAYPDQDFMNILTLAIKKEYPQFTIFGEVWEHGPAIQSWYAKNKGVNAKSEMPGAIDFELYYAINEALTKPFGWTDGAARIYYTLAQDFLYNEAKNNVVFLDNHDLNRFTSMIDGNLKKFKSGITFLLTTRGTPVLFYGTEILMKAWSNPDAKVRLDFPGGWEGDPKNKFTTGGRTNEENEAFNHIKKLAAYRAKTSAITDGELMQFVPEKGIYVYFRHDKIKTVMIIMNTNAESITLETARYKERMTGFTGGYDVVNDKKLTDIKNIAVGGFETMVVELGK